jgi:hypothetical protein
MSVEQRPARRHHVVSKFYLRYFAHDDGMLTTIELPGRPFPQSVESASVRTDFYTALNSAGQETDAAERVFGEIEGPAATAWRLVAAGRRGAWGRCRVDRAPPVAHQRNPPVPD